MLNFSRIVVLFLTVLISSVNSIFYGSFIPQEKLIYSDKSSTEAQHFSDRAHILFLNTELRSGGNSLPSNSEQILQKTKFWNSFNKNPLNNRDPRDPIKSVFQRITLVADIFDSPDISFPFQYFW